MIIAPGPDLNPSDHVHVEVAFTTGPDDPAPAWVDLTSRVRIAESIDITRGRQDEFSTCQPGHCSVTFENIDGALTPGRAASPYYPNVIPNRRMRVKYVDPNSGAVQYLFDGYVEEWPTAWPTGQDTYATSRITALDLLSRLGRAGVLNSVIVQTVLLDSPTAYYVLGEPAGATSAGDSSGTAGTGPLTIAQTGTGGTVAFAAGTGPGTDGVSAPTFTPVNVNNGQYLAGTIAPVGGSNNASIEVAFSTSTAVAQTIARAADPYGAYLELATDATGHLVGSFYDPSGYRAPLTLTSPTVVSDGATHEAAVTVTVGSRTLNMTLVLDGASVTTGGGVVVPFLPLCTLAQIGGTPTGRMFTGTVAHFSTYDANVAVAQFTTHNTAMTTGFAGETSDQRITRIASWVGIPSARLNLQTGSSAIAHVECTGLNPLDYMRQVETAEGGVLYADTQGRLAFTARPATYTPTMPSVTVDASVVAESTQPVENLLAVKNDVTVTRANGATIRRTDPASIAAYGSIADSVTTIVTSDTAAADLASWRLAQFSKPRVRIPQLGLDGYTDQSYSAQIRTLDIGSHLQVTGLPAQAPTTTTDQVVQGYSLVISDSGWDITANTTDFTSMLALVLDDATYGLLDGPGVLTY
ncbi:MAG: hypothetical protein ACXVGQ_00380 [Mycobacteriaceae bacterium]